MRARASHTISVYSNPPTEVCPEVNTMHMRTRARACSRSRQHATLTTIQYAMYTECELVDGCVFCLHIHMSMQYYTGHPHPTTATTRVSFRIFSRREFSIFLVIFRYRISSITHVLHFKNFKKFKNCIATNSVYSFYMNM